MRPYIFGQAISQSFQTKMISHTLQQIHRLTSFFAIKMNMKLFHIAAPKGKCSAFLHFCIKFMTSDTCAEILCAIKVSSMLKTCFTVSAATQITLNFNSISSNYTGQEVL